MAEYIEREKALKILRDSGDAYGDFSTERSVYLSAREKVSRIPAAGVAPVVHGRWETYSTTMMACSQCGKHTAKHRFDYCPKCGARMDEEAEQ